LFHAGLTRGAMGLFQRWTGFHGDDAMTAHRGSRDGLSAAPLRAALQPPERDRTLLTLFNFHANMSRGSSRHLQRIDFYWRLGDVDCGLVAMRSEAEKYHAYARECVRLAARAETPELRDKLIDLARVWMDAALTQEEAEERETRPLSLTPPWPSGAVILKFALSAARQIHP